MATAIEIIIDNYKCANPKLLYGGRINTYLTPKSTILMEAVIFNTCINLDNLDLLIKEYLEVNPEEINKKDDYGYYGCNWTAIMYACSSHIKNNYVNKLGIIKVLIEAGADLNLQDNENRTPLILACSYFYRLGEKINIPIIKLLIEHTSNLNHKDKFEETAFDKFYKSFDDDDKIFSNEIFKLFVEHNVTYRNTNLKNIIKIFKQKNKIKMLKNQIQTLKIELECVPGSSYVKKIEEHFNSLINL